MRGAGAEQLREELAQKQRQLDENKHEIHRLLQAPVVHDGEDRPFTSEEHQRFLEALETYGRGREGDEWEKIAQHVGKDRTVAEVKSYGQHYYWRLQLVSPSTPLSQGEGVTSWMLEDNLLFENALSIVDPNAPERWNWVAACVPSKTPRECEMHYEALVRDVQKIIDGRIELPTYQHSRFTVTWPENYERRRKELRPEERRKGVPWSDTEHMQFLQGLLKYGKGDWRSISKHCVKTRTPTQVASHAQKFFIRLGSANRERKRPPMYAQQEQDAGDGQPTVAELEALVKDRLEKNELVRASSASMGSSAGDAEMLSSHNDEGRSERAPSSTRAGGRARRSSHGSVSRDANTDTQHSTHSNESENKRVRLR